MKKFFEKPINTEESSGEKVHEKISFDGRLGEILKKENKEGLPELSVKVFYSAHASGEDIKNLEKNLDESDIYMPEFAGWSNDVPKSFQDVSRGYRSPEEAIKDLEKQNVYFSDDDFYKEILRMLYKKRKFVAFIDLPKGHPVKDKLSAFYSRETLPERFKEALEIVKEWAKEYQDLQRQREEYMIAHLFPKIRELLKIDSLKKKKNINILLSLGSAHTWIYHGLKKEKTIKSSQEFSHLPIVFPMIDEVRRRTLLGKDIDENLLAQTLLEGIVGKYLETEIFKVTKDYLKISYFLRYVASQFNKEEVREMYESSEGFVKAFKKKLTDKNLSFPKSEEELNVVLKIQDKNGE